MCLLCCGAAVAPVPVVERTGSCCGHCTKLQTHAEKPLQAATREHQVICVSARLLIMSTWCLMSVRGQNTDLFTHHCHQVPSCLSKSHVMGLTMSWMGMPMISLRTELSKLSEPAQPAHCPGHLGSNFSSGISSLLQDWMNYVRFLGPQTGKMGL